MPMSPRTDTAIKTRQYGSTEAPPSIRSAVARVLHTTGADVAFPRSSPAADADERTTQAAAKA
jgi:hypothetical protein